MRPFEYFSYRETGPYGPFLYTFELSESGGETTISVRVRLLGGRRQGVMMRLGAKKFKGIIEGSLDKLRGLVEAGEPG